MITSRLSTLLVRDGIVPVKRMELAFQRQVIYGGGLDTVLLEMGALHEERLWHYLSLATGLPTAELDMLEYIDPRGAQVCPREIAETYQVAPLGLFGEALRLLVTDPVDLGRLEDLATALGVPIQPFVVPEFRFHLVVERLFGVPVAPRFAALSRQRAQRAKKEAGEAKVQVDLGAAHPARRTQPFGGAGEENRRTGDTWPGGSRPRLPGLPPESRKPVARMGSAPPVTSVRSLGQPPPPPVDVMPVPAPPPSSSSTLPPTQPLPRATTPPPVATAPARAGTPPPTAPSGPPPSGADGFLASLTRASGNTKATLTGLGLAGRPRELAAVAPPANDGAGRDTQPFQVVPEEGVAAGEVESPEDAAAREARGLGLALEQGPEVSTEERARVLAAEAAPPTTSGPLYPEDERTDHEEQEDVMHASTDAVELRALEREMSEAGAMDDVAPEEATPVPVASERTDPVPAPWRGAVALDPEPLGAKAASDLLVKATDRDAVFHALLRAARGVGSGAALFVVLGDAATGKLALDERGVDAAAVAAMRIPIADVPVFAQALTTRTLAIGLVDGPAADALGVLGVRVGVATAALPVILRDRVVAIVLAHRGDRAMTLAAAAPLAALGTEGSLALARLIVRAKEIVRARLAEPVEAASEARSAPITLAPGDAAAAAARADEPPKPVVDERPTGDLMDAALAGDAAAEAMLRARPGEVTRELTARFPGPLHDDRFQGLVRPLTASEHGPLLALAARLGASITAPVLLTKMAGGDGDGRYYATLLAGEVRSPELLTALVERVFDPDKSIRAVALEALLYYPARDVDRALVPVRQALKDDPPRVRAAAYALEKLRDVSSIPGLISALEVGGATAEECRRALIELTKHDFGTKSRKWHSWWEEHRGKPRIEWMLEGLAHAEDRIRLSASEELRRLTGEHFGYVFDMPRREREEAQERWQTWWRQTGRRRFLGPTKRS